MINRLTKPCGYEFTNKLHRMFTSLPTWITNSAFPWKQRSNWTRLQLLHLRVTSWCPTSRSDELPNWFCRKTRVGEIYPSFPRLLLGAVQWPQTSYTVWVNLKLNYLNKPYIITMQTFQISMLLMSEKTDSMTSCRELMEATKLNLDHFQKYVQSVFESKLLTAWLLEVAKCLNLLPSLWLTWIITTKTKFRITTAVQKEAVQETEQTHSSVDEDTQPTHAHRSDVDNSSIFCGKHRRKRYRPDIGNGTRVFDIDIVVRCTYDEIQTTIFHSWTTYEIHVNDVELHRICLYMFNISWASPFILSPNKICIL